MQFQSKRNRNLIVSTLYNLIPDAIIALATALITDGGFWMFVGVMVGLQILYLAITIKDALWLWAFYKFKGKKETTQYYYDYLVDNNFPRPDEYHSDVNDYFSVIVDDEKQKSEIRLKAAFELGSLAYLASSGAMTKHMQTGICFEDAIERYDRSFGPREYDDDKEDDYEDDDE